MKENVDTKRSFAKYWIRALALLAGITLLGLGSLQAKEHNHESEGRADRYIQVMAKDKFERSKIADLGMSIEAFRSDSVWGFATTETLQQLKAAGFEVAGDFDISVSRGGHESAGLLDFPTEDARFHNYAELNTELQTLVSAHSDIAKLHVIGKTQENRDLVILHINTDPNALNTGMSDKPGIFYVGNHHAREHLSVEIPLMYAQHLLNNRNDARISKLLGSRDIWILPMLNPDGSEYDIESGSYRMWRKNRRPNGNNVFGVDLNRNYGFGWGTGGSSKDPKSDTYMGPGPFSEPETQAVKNFVSAHANLKVLLTVHTFSELILYPWGGKYDPISDQRDLAVFETMARTMAGWNGYKPQKSSDLYIASGDTCDWAYGEHKIFAFTFELSPRSMWEGGFYPGARVIDRVFQANLEPMLYMLDYTDNPYRVLNTNAPETEFLTSFAPSSM